MLVGTWVTGTVGMVTVTCVVGIAVGTVVGIAVGGVVGTVVGTVVTGMSFSVASMAACSPAPSVFWAENGS
jgi:large-conductance mechanosensitive channel